jgi:hypothetical protein
MKINKILYILTLITLAFTVLITGCKDNYDYINYEKLEANEKKLLERFYESRLFNEAIVLKAIELDDNEKVIDTLDLRESLKFFMARNYRDTLNTYSEYKYTDTIKTGQTVGYRYTFSYVDTDENDSIVAYVLFSNIFNDEPDYYTVGNYTTTSAAMSYGIDLGIRNMFFGDKCTMVMPSAIGAQALLASYAAKDRYKIIIADIEITYLPR